MQHILHTFPEPSELVASGWWGLCNRPCTAKVLPGEGEASPLPHSSGVEARGGEVLHNRVEHEPLRPLLLAS